MESQNMGSASGDNEAQNSSASSARKRGGWITFPFVAATLAGLMLSGWGWLTNLIVYLIEEFNVKSIDATQISNVVHGCLNMIPILGAILADSYLGSFSVVSIFSFFSLLGAILLSLTASIGSLRPQHCEISSSFCQQASSKVQLAVLYVAITLASTGLGVIRFTLATLGANQFDEPKDQVVFIDWFFFTFYAANAISSIAIVYIEDNISWVLGFGLCAAFNLIGLIIFLSGSRFYRHDKPRGSPFTSIARVVVAAIRKRNVVLLSSKNEDYYHGNNEEAVDSIPERSFRFFNRAALKTEGDTNSDGSIAKPWRLCTMQQVKDLKSLIRILPVWSSSIFVVTPIAVQMSMTVLQALAMDRHIGSNFIKIPAGSVIVVVLISTSVFIALLDRFLIPAWQKLTGRSLTSLERIGIGHVFNVSSMVVSAFVEAKRLKIGRDHHLDQEHYKVAAPMSVLWLFPQLVLVGIGEALHLPGNVSFYYREFPVSLKSTATAMMSTVIGIGFYASTIMVELIKNVTNWLPDDINKGRLDNFFWTLVVLGLLNFCYYLVCAKFYKYQNVEKEDSETQFPAHAHM